MLNLTNRLAWTLVVVLASAINAADATVYPLPPDNSRLIGENTTHTVMQDGGSLEAIADKYKIGLLAMLEANPGTDPWLPRPGTVLTIPSQMLLPGTPRKGIVINLAELRRYYYHPMGLYALRLAAGSSTYLIHGTNANFGIGMRVSSGCIRLRPDDIEALFNSVPVINEPVKVAVEPDGKRYVEVHQPLSRSEKDDPQTLPIRINARTVTFVAQPATDCVMVKQAVARSSRMPVLINNGEPVTPASSAAETQAAQGSATDPAPGA